MRTSHTSISWSVLVGRPEGKWPLARPRRRWEVYKYTMMYQTQQHVIMFIIVLGQHVSILIESSSGPSQNTDPYCILRMA